MKYFLAFTIAVCAVVLPVNDVSAHSCKKSKTVVPDGFDSMLVYLATGLVDQTVDPVGGPTSCVAGQCDGAWFHSEIMGREQSEMDYLEGLAKDFYMTRFGIDVDADLVSGRIAFGTWSGAPIPGYSTGTTLTRDEPSFPAVRRFVMVVGKSPFWTPLGMTSGVNLLASMLTRERKPSGATTTLPIAREMAKSNLKKSSGIERVLFLRPMSYSKSWPSVS